MESFPIFMFILPRIRPAASPKDGVAARESVPDREGSGGFPSLSAAMGDS
jgi:hypothetical protein